MSNSLTLRQKAVVATLAVVALYVGAVLFWFVSAEKTWKKSANAYHKAKQKYEREARLIREKSYWEEACEKEQSSMRVFGEGQATDTTWMRKMGEIAKSNLVYVVSSDPQEEVLGVGEDVRVLPIEASWEASLEALVKFLYALENSDEGLFDFTKLVISKFDSRTGYLKGNLVVTCAYRRGKVEEAKEEARVTEEEGDLGVARDARPVSLANP